YEYMISSLCQYGTNLVKLYDIVLNNTIHYKQRTMAREGLKGSEPISNADHLHQKCDVLVPAALENQVTLGNAVRINATIVAEAANAAITPGADEVLLKNGSFLIPDILCNAGGVIVSYFEWVQDLQGLFWTEGEVNN